MYALWLDARLNSRLVREGFSLSQLRASFVLAAAADLKTGLGARELVRADAKALHAELFADKSARATVSKDVFDGGVMALEGLRKRDSTAS